MKLNEIMTMKITPKLINQNFTSNFILTYFEPQKKTSALPVFIQVRTTMLRSLNGMRKCSSEIRLDKPHSSPAHRTLKATVSNSPPLGRMCILKPRRAPLKSV